MTGDFYGNAFNVPERDCVTMKRIIYPDLGLDPHKVEHGPMFGEELDIYNKPSEQAFLNDKYVDKTDTYLLQKKLRIPTRGEDILEKYGVGKTDWSKDISVNPVKTHVETDILGNPIETNHLSGKRYATVFGVRTEINIGGYPVPKKDNASMY